MCIRDRLWLPSKLFAVHCGECRGAIMALYSLLYRVSEPEERAWWSPVVLVSSWGASAPPVLEGAGAVSHPYRLRDPVRWVFPMDRLVDELTGVLCLVCLLFCWCLLCCACRRVLVGGIIPCWWCGEMGWVAVVVPEKHLA